MSNDIFISKWTGEKTGYEYYLQVYSFGYSTSAPYPVININPLKSQTGADGLSYFSPDQTNTNNVNLPEGIIDKLDYAWKCDDYPMGYINPSLKINFNLGLYNNPSSDFCGILLQGYTYANPNGNYIANIQLGNVCILSVKYNNTNEPSGLFLPIFIGVQKNSVANGYDIKTGFFTAEFWDIGRVVGENFNTLTMNLMFTTSQYRGAKFYYDHIFGYYSVDDWWYWGNLSFPVTTNKEQYTAGIYTPGYFWMQLISDWFTEISQILNVVCSDLLRQSVTTIDLKHNQPTYYKQVYDNLGTKGTALDDTNLYLISYVSNVEAWHGGSAAVINGIQASDKDIVGGFSLSNLTADFKNFYDFLLDYSKDTLRKIWFNPVTLNYDSYKILNNNKVFMYLDSERVNQSIIEPDFKPMQKILSHAESPVTEKVGNDIDKYTAQTNSGRNELTKTFPVIINNTPAANNPKGDGTYDLTEQKMMRRGNPAVGFLKNDKSVMYQSQISRLRNLYYFDLPNISGNDIVTSHVPIRVHEYCSFDLGAGFTSDRFVTFYAMDFTSKYKVAQRIFAAPSNPEINYLQQYSGKPYVIANTMLGLFSTPYQSNLKGVCLFSAGNDWSSGGNPFINPDMHIVVSNDQYAIKLNTNPFSNYYTDYYLTDVQVDLLTEMVTFEALSIKNFSKTESIEMDTTKYKRTLSNNVTTDLFTINVPANTSFNGYLFIAVNASNATKSRTYNIIPNSMRVLIDNVNGTITATTPSYIGNTNGGSDTPLVSSTTLTNAVKISINANITEFTPTNLTVQYYIINLSDNTITIL